MLLTPNNLTIGDTMTAPPAREPYCYSPPPSVDGGDRFEVYELRLVATGGSTEAAEAAIRAQFDDGPEDERGPFIIVDDRSTWRSLIYDEPPAPPAPEDGVTGSND